MDPYDYYPSDPNGPTLAAPVAQPQPQRPLSSLQIDGMWMGWEEVVPSSVAEKGVTTGDPLPSLDTDHHHHHHHHHHHQHQHQHQKERVGPGPSTQPRALEAETSNAAFLRRPYDQPENGPPPSWARTPRFSVPSVSAGTPPPAPPATRSSPSSSPPSSSSSSSSVAWQAGPNAAAANEAPLDARLLAEVGLHQTNENPKALASQMQSNLRLARAAMWYFLLDVAWAVVERRYEAFVPLEFVGPYRALELAFGEDILTMALASHFPLDREPDGTVDVVDDLETAASHGTRDVPSAYRHPRQADPPAGAPVWPGEPPADPILWHERALSMHYGGPDRAVTRRRAAVPSPAVADKSPGRAWSEQRKAYRAHMHRWLRWTDQCEVGITMEAVPSAESFPSAGAAIGAERRGSQAKRARTGAAASLPELFRYHLRLVAPATDARRRTWHYEAVRLLNHPFGDGTHLRPVPGLCSLEACHERRSDLERCAREEPDLFWHLLRRPVHMSGAQVHPLVPPRLLVREVALSPEAAAQPDGPIRGSSSQKLVQWWDLAGEPHMATVLWPSSYHQFCKQMKMDPAKVAVAPAQGRRSPSSPPGAVRPGNSRPDDKGGEDGDPDRDCTVDQFCGYDYVYLRQQQPQLCLFPAYQLPPPPPPGFSDAATAADRTAATARWRLMPEADDEEVRRMRPAPLLLAMASANIHWRPHVLPHGVSASSRHGHHRH